MYIFILGVQNVIPGYNNILLIIIWLTLFQEMKCINIFILNQTLTE